jgi:bisphosphoglycerate-independent phosphoglycerate mutase (AlkP superfamily)
MKSTQTAGEGIVDRLTGALSTMRKERDELHREKDIAHERRGEVHERRSEVEKVVLSMRKELEQLMIETSGQGRKTENESIEKLVTEVERLAKEVRNNDSLSSAALE